MDTRHSDTLNSRLDEIITNGATYIMWNELYLWYDSKAIAAATYRDINARWSDIVKRHKKKHGTNLGHLKQVQASEKHQGGIFLFASSKVKDFENPDA